MRAVYVERFEPEDPVAALVVGERPLPEPPPGWERVHVAAASLNHHDVWSARGVGLRRERLPMILGCDAAGTAEDATEVIVYACVNDPEWVGDELLDPRGSILSERHQGTFAEAVIVPRRNLVRKPAELSMSEAACLPTAWLTAYRMLFTQAAMRPGQTVLVQGASGGLSAALIALGHAAGLRVWVTGRTEAKRAFATELGAEAVFEPGARLPERVDAVMDSVGAPTWSHSLKALRKGGAMVVAGGTGGYSAQTEVARVFAMGLRILGSAMGSRDELVELVRMLVQTGLRPSVERELPLGAAAEGFAAMVAGETRGKIVFTV